MFEPDATSESALGDADFCQRVVKYLDGDVDSAEARLLNDELQAERAKRAAFVRLCRIRSILINDGILDKVARSRQQGWGTDDGVEYSESDRHFELAHYSATRCNDSPETLLSETMILPALRGAGTRTDLGLTVAPALSQSGAPRRHLNSRWRWAAVAAAAAIALVPALLLRQKRVGPLHQVALVPPGRPPAVVSATAGAQFHGTVSVSPGSPLGASEDLELTSGALEITFESAAVVVVSAPARVSVLDRNRMSLVSGALAAHVPPSAIGFQVNAPGLVAVDQGTDFGMRVVGNSLGTELDVFKGAVDARAPNAAEPAPAPAKTTPTRVTGGQAVIHMVGDPASPQPAAYDPTAFVRSVGAYRVSVPLNGTGAGLPFRTVDPNWTVVADPNGLRSEPLPTFTVALSRYLYAHTTAAAKWISIAAEPGNSQPGQYTFRSTVTLPDFQPGTLSMAASWDADDRIVDIFVNGTSTAKANTDVLARDSRAHPLSWSLDGAPWRAGDNRVDVLVYNKPAGQNAAGGQLGLKLFWMSSLAPVVHSSANSATGVPAGAR